MDKEISVAAQFKVANQLTVGYYPGLSEGDSAMTRTTEAVEGGRTGDQSGAM